MRTNAEHIPGKRSTALQLPHRKGIGNTEIAKQIGVSRQTIYKYIYNAEHFTDRIPLRAFGVVENPSWADFEEFLKERCLPASRAGLKGILREMDVPFYDPLLIIEKTNGRMAGDNQWVQVIHNTAA